MEREAPEIFACTLSAPVIVSPPISTYLLSASLWSSIFDVPQVRVPSLCVVIMEQLARLVTAREVPVIPPATSSFVCGVVSPIPIFPPSTIEIPSSVSVIVEAVNCNRLIFLALKYADVAAEPFAL